MRPAPAPRPAPPPAPPAAQPAGLEHLSDRHFALIAAFVERRVGIQLPPSKRTMVEGRLRKRVRALGLRSLDDYASRLFEHGQFEEELPSLIDCVTTNKTDFFREPAHFDFLRQTIVPAFLARAGHRPLKVWSAASSIGAEAYTTAMVLQDLATAGPAFRFAILGTDVSGEVVEQARAAIYPEAMLEPVPAPMRQRYVMPSRRPGEPLARIVPELRRLVQFHELNLMDQSYPFDRDIDVIFCRNVLIYFDKLTQHAVIQRLVSHLRPGGYLMLGHSESMASTEAVGLKPVLPAIYQA